MTSPGRVPIPFLPAVLAAVLCWPAHAQFTQQGSKLVGAGATTAAFQGDAVALSGDGNTLVVGGYGDNNGLGALWVFTRSNGVWSQQGNKLTGTGAVGTTPQQAVSVAISADGNTLIEGANLDGADNNTGAVWFFTRANGTWSQQGAKVVGAGAIGSANQGFSVALSADGNTAIAGGYGDNSGVGAAWVFTRTNGAWSQQGKLVGSGSVGASQQGSAVSLSADGNTALVGGWHDNSDQGALWIFTRSGGVWSQQGAKVVGAGAVGPNVYQGCAAALSSDGNTAISTGYGDNQNVGAAWIFTRAAGVWTQQGAKLVGAGATTAALQGFSAALSADGNTAIIGGRADGYTGVGYDATGAAWVFKRSNGAWSQVGNKLVGTGGVHGTVGGTAIGPQEGYSVAISGDGTTVALGGYLDNTLVGATWVFVQPPHFSVQAPSTATAGTAFNFTVSALDPNNALLASYAGTVHFTSSDPAAVLPADSTLSSGVGSFSATLRTTGNQTITATDTVTSGTGASGAIAVSLTTVPPAPVSVNPSSGGASSQTFTLAYTDPRGYQDIGVANILVNNFLDGRHACYLAFVMASNTLILVDDAGDAGGPYAGSVALGNAAAIQNSQCAVNLVSAVGSGNNLALTLAIAWTTGFAGDKVVYMAARDIAQNNSGWQPLGVWRAPGGTPATTTAVVDTIPSRGTGMGPAQFLFDYSDTKGFADLGVENILVNSSLDGRHACYLAISRPGNVLYLVNDNGDALLPGQSLGGAGSVNNSQCTVTWGSAPVNGGGNSLALTLSIAFSAAFGGNRVIYVAARDVNEANNTDWHAMGTWTVQ
ncbi:MAG TPA: hypothetical protein VE959_33240 [Bryobacteraceae bacterium]|nr:hypothetical protein [Bryobacteraceae bacterium]